MVGFRAWPRTGWPDGSDEMKDDRYWHCLDQAMEASHGGHTDEAMAWLDEALKENPNGAEAHNGRGEILWDDTRIDEALYEFELATLADPKFATAHLNRAELLIEELGEYEEALQLCDRLLGGAAEQAIAQLERFLVLAELLDQELRAVQVGRRELGIGQGGQLELVQRLVDPGVVPENLAAAVVGLGAVGVLLQGLVEPGHRLVGMATVRGFHGLVQAVPVSIVLHFIRSIGPPGPGPCAEADHSRRPPAASPALLVGTIQ